MFYQLSKNFVRIRSYSGPYFPAFELNSDQNNSEYRHFSRSDGFSVFQNYLLFVASRLFKKSFLVFCSNLTQIFRCFLYAACDNVVFSCLTLFNNRDLVMISFLKFLLTNAAWLHIPCFSFNGTCHAYTKQ